MNRAATYLVLPAVLAATGFASAAPIAWDGNGASNNSGTWGTTAGNELNWAGDVNPGTGDVAELLDVTTGTRTVTLANATTVQGLTITQDTAAAINQLDLGANLTLTTASPFTVTTGAGVPASALVVNVGNKTISMTANNTLISDTLAGTWNLAGGRIAGGTVSAGGNNSAGTQITFTGDLNVTGGTNRMGHENLYSGVSGSNNNNQTSSITISSGATLDVTGSSALSVEHAIRGSGAVHFINAGTTTVTAGSNLTAFRRYMTGDSNGVVLINNQASGLMAHSGTVELKAQRGTNQNLTTTTTRSITNAGTWEVNGTSAKIVASTVSGGNNNVEAGTVPTFTNSGTLRGSQALSTLDFDNNLGKTDRLTMSSSGVISPGLGHDGAGTASVGTLNLSDINVTFSGANDTLRLDLGGSVEGEFDVLSLVGGTLGAGTLTIDSTPSTGSNPSTGSKLELYYVNGYAPAPNTSWTVLNFGSVSGTFDLATNLAIFGASGFAADPANYSIVYGANTATLTVVPEPTALAVVSALPLLGFARRRRA